MNSAARRFLTSLGRLRATPRIGPFALPAVAILFCTSASHAAIPGEIDGISTGYVGIRASVAPRTQVVGLADSATLPKTGAPSSQEACVSTNSATGLYSVTPQEALTLTSADGAIATYSATWTDPGNGPQALAPGHRLDALASPACTGRSNARLTLSSAAPDREIYTGTLILLIAPL